MKHVLLFLFLGFFQLNAQSYLDYYFKANNVKGGIVIYDENKNQWIFNSESEAFTNTPIASHFNLWQALIGLDEQVFKTDINNKQLWDGVKITFFGKKKTEWNHDSNLIDALKYKNDWYFQRLKFLLPVEKYQTKILNSPLITEVKNNEWDFFWNYGVNTNPNTLITFLKNLKENKLPFNSKHQQFLYNQFLIDNSLAINTATTHYNGEKIEWTIGVYLKHDKPIYYSYRTRQSLEDEDDFDYNKRRNLVLTQIFEVLGY